MYNVLVYISRFRLSDSAARERRRARRQRTPWRTRWNAARSRSTNQLLMVEHVLQPRELGQPNGRLRGIEPAHSWTW